MKPHRKQGLQEVPLPAILLVGRTLWIRRLTWLILLFILAVPICLIFVPWQQNLPGIGRVIEFDPIHRPMPLHARTDGIILKWHVREGQWVKTGDPIVDIVDNDPLILERIQAQLDSAIAKRDASQRTRLDYETQLAEAQEARDAAIRMADDDIVAAQQAVTSAQQAVKVAEENVHLGEFMQAMFQGLIEEKIAPGFELQRAKQQLAVALADLQAKQAEVEARRASLRARQSARQRVERDEQVKIQAIKAKVNDADGHIAEAEQSIQRLERDLQRQRAQSLQAPTSGYVQHLIANGQGGSFVKAGTPMATLIPESKQLAVELIVDGNDVTFIREGAHVRLQFEGWPAVQFVGWPSAAVGTFGGRVAFVDRFDRGNGKFRVMVLPDERPFEEPEGPVARWMRDVLTHEVVHEAENPHAWPDERWLRQGVLAKGWVMLDEVPLGYEVWRQLNGFPPTIEKPRDYGNSKKGDLVAPEGAEAREVSK